MPTARRWIAREAAFLTGERARLVVADIPPLPIAAARRAGVPAIGISNFTWDWIYEDYDARRLAPGLVETPRGALRLGRRGLAPADARRLRQLRDAARPAARRPRRPAAARRRCAPRWACRRTGRWCWCRSAATAPAASTCTRAAASLRGVADVVATSYDAFTPGDGVHRVDETAMYGQRIRYEDLVGAVDVVASKPGYGIISECAANGTALLYTDRGRFCEYDVLVREMPRYLEAAFIGQEDLLAGRWRDAVAELLGRPPRAAAPADGATTAADWLSARALDRG